MTKPEEMRAFFAARVDGYDAHMLQNVQGVKEGYAQMTALLVFMVFDYISGLIVAGMGKSTKTESGGLRSRKSRRMRECRQFFTDNFTDICTGEHSFSPFCAVFS